METGAAGQGAGAVIGTALAGAERAAGAAMGEWFGCELPSHFGDWVGEYKLLREGVALLDKGYRAYIEFTGPDRFRYLNAILTNNIRDLRENHGVVSLFLSPQGHIQAEIETYNLGDALFCVSFARVREALVAGLDRYIIMDDVTLTDRTDEFTTLALEGPKSGLAAEELTGIDVADLAELETRAVTVSGIACRLVKRTPGEHASAEFVVARGRAEELWHELLRAVRHHNGGAAGYTALNALRLEQGVPWFSYDFGGKQIPHEAGLHESHISYTKGCYTGQEIVERVRSRGQVNRARVLLKVEGCDVPEAGTPLLADGKEVGQITRAGFSPKLGSAIAMGYVRREKSGMDATVELGSGGKASVIVAPG